MPTSLPAPTPDHNRGRTDVSPAPSPHRRRGPAGRPRPHPIDWVASVPLGGDASGPSARLRRDVLAQLLTIELDEPPAAAYGVLLRWYGWAASGGGRCWVKPVEAGRRPLRAADDAEEVRVFVTLANSIREDNGLPPARVRFYHPGDGAGG